MSSSPLDSRRKPMICSSLNRFFMSNPSRLGDWTANGCATQNRGTSKSILKQGARGLT